MCSTIHPCPGARCFSFTQTKHFCKAPANSSHQQLTLGDMLTPSLRSGVSKCAGLSAFVRGPTISVFCKLGLFVKPEPVALTKS